MRKTRPCLVVSPDEMNEDLSTVIIAPMTTRRRGYPTRVPIAFLGKDGEVALDQLRTVDSDRLRKRLGQVSDSEKRHVVTKLLELFSW
jgi:mRNA interferase MazF